MSSLNKTDDWSEKVEKLEKRECDKLTNDYWDSTRATNILVEASKDENYSLTDFWAYFIVCGMLKEVGADMSFTD